MHVGDSVDEWLGYGNRLCRGWDGQGAKDVTRKIKQLGRDEAGLMSRPTGRFWVASFCQS
jgi:hypothetical protein